MGYQALLFCPDEKLARVVAQVFSELDFNLEPVQEPFSAVKKLMAQRYDALVVDCESESNAALLFKSARNSSSNQGTLAIAIVEGQAGVAKAYRMGANLVLTKPINMEQAKGTLRVARGLLRKSADTSTAVPPSTPSPPPEKAGYRAAQGRVEGFSPAMTVTAPSAASAAEVAGSASSESYGAETPPTAQPELTEFEPTVSAHAAEMPVGASHAESVGMGAPGVKAREPAVAETAEEAPGRAPSTPASTAASASPASQAAAPAKAKEAKLEKLPEFQRLDRIPEANGGEAGVSSASLRGSLARLSTDAPAFAAFHEHESKRSGAGKKILIAAIVLVAAAALAYLGWTRFGLRKFISPPRPSLSQSSAPAPTPAPLPKPPATVSPPATSHTTDASSLISTSKVIAATDSAKSGDSLILRLDSTSSDQSPKAPNAAPIKVKPASAKQPPRASAEESVASAPNPLAIASASQSTLNNLAASPPAVSRHPTLATVRLSQGVAQGMLIKRVNPVYPASARAMHVQGSVVLEATIDREGRVVNTTVVKGDKALAQAALDAVRQWRYKPYYLDNQPVEVKTQIIVNFVLPN